MIRFLFLLMYAPTTVASSQWQDIMEARSTQELMEVSEYWGPVLQTKKRCDWEIENQLFPLSCFDYLHRAMLRPYHGEILTMDFAQIGQICAERAQQIENLEKIKSILNFDWVKPPCRNALNVRLLDLQYQKARKLNK